MRRWTVAAVLTWAALGVGGCASGPLSRDEEVRLLRAKNADLEARLLASERPAADLVAAGARPAPAAPAPEDPFRPVAVRFGTFTGVLSTDGRPDQERLKVILEPVDAEGDAVKRAGRLDLEAFEPAAAGQPPRPYHRWQFSMAELAQTWLDVFGSRGYVMKFAWPAGRRPAAAALLLRARFTALSGEVLTAETQVPVPPPAAPASRKP